LLKEIQSTYLKGNHEKYLELVKEGLKKLF